MLRLMGNKNVIEFPLDAKEFANLLLDWADEVFVTISPMKLQKLMYYCHADFMSLYGIPLVIDDFEAWQFGPVLPNVFQEFKQFSGSAITSRARRFNPLTAKTEIAPASCLGDYDKHVRELFDIYIGFSATSLSNMSHVEDGPWIEALVRFEKGVNPKRRIGNDLIRSHHRSAKRQVH